ncbi:hypothetical protein DUNSADRAFT_2748, partial [Dunaliella salina]
PPLGYLSSCLRRLGVLCHSAQPQALANSVWALGKMGVAVPPNILRRLLQASYRNMYQFTPQGLVCLVYGFASMRPRPVLPKAWQLKLFDASWRFMRPGPPDTSSPLPAMAGSKQEEGSEDSSLLSNGGVGQEGEQNSMSSQYCTQPSGPLHVTGSTEQGENMDDSVLGARGAGQQTQQSSVSSQQGSQQPVSLLLSAQQSEEVEQERGSSSSRSGNSSSSSSNSREARAHQNNINNPAWAVQEGGGSNSSRGGSNSRKAQAHENHNSPVWGSGGAVMGLRQSGPKLHASTLICLLRGLVLARAFPSKPWLAECFAQVGVLGGCSVWLGDLRMWVLNWRAQCMWMLVGVLYAGGCAGHVNADWRALCKRVFCAEVWHALAERTPSPVWVWSACDVKLCQCYVSRSVECDGTQ